MQEADKVFREGQYAKATQLYKQFIANESDNEKISIALLNLSSAYFTSGSYKECMQSCMEYEKKSKEMGKQPKVECFILFCRSVIRLKKLLTHQQHKFIQQGQTTFPYHKTLLQSIKTVKQLQISQNEDEYMDRMFQKLLSHPKIRQYMVEESFLTKVEKIIRNPSLSGILAKTDKRLEEVMEVILMAEGEEEQGKGQGNVGK